MKYRKNIQFAMLLSAVVISVSSFGQLTPSEAGYLDAVTDFGADNTGATVTTTELQAAIYAATSQHKPLFIPGGTYLVDATLVVSDDAGGDRDAQNTFITGSSIDPENRTVILLKAGSFPLAHKHVIRHEGFGDEKYPDTFDRMLQSIDIRIEEDNAGAIGLRWRGAEGCGIFDINIDVTGGAYGMEMLPGSGGSCADISITGGIHGIHLPTDAVQPTPTITNLTMSGQTGAAIYSDHTRGAFTITGAHFIMEPGVPVFSLARHTGLTWSPGGNPVLTDCVIEYPTEDAGNIVMEMVDDRDLSVHFSDVYVKNAALILDEDATAAANPSGWRYYREFAYNSGWDRNPGGDEPVYIDGVKQTGRIWEISEDGLSPPPDIQSRHGWGDTFPSFNSPGAINVKDYEEMVNSYDWAPAFNAAIEAAETNGSNIVFVPVGKYIIYNTIYLKEHTALVGAGHQNSIILGRDEKNRRFGGSESGWTDPRPMIETPNSNSATCILADIAVRVNGPYNNEAHSSEAIACYAILWQAGNYSIIRNIDYMRENRTNYRSAWALQNNLTSDKWIRLRNIDSPSEIGGFTFNSDCAHAYHTSFTVPSRILLETVGGDQRIMTRSLPPPRMNAVSNRFDIPNLTIKSAGGSTFTFESLKLANASWLASEGSDVTITAYGAEPLEQVVSMAGMSRETEKLVTADWTGLDSIVIISPVPFSIDDISLDGTVLDFEDVNGTIPEENVDYDHLCSGYGFMHLPMYYMAHPYISITGGCKYYNHWKHGSTWMRVTEPYVEVCDNEPSDIVSFYHTHAQHSENFYKFRIHNAYNVSLFGIKTENALEFAHIDSSENIRVFGHGGMTNPPRGTAHYRVENSVDFEIVSPTDEIVTSADACRSCGLGDAMLPATTFGHYDDIQYLDHGTLYTPDMTDSPILYRWGNPHDPWSGRCDVQYEVVVTGGTGGWNYCPGDRVTIRPRIPECKHFVKWSGDNTFLEDSTIATAVIPSMPAYNLDLTAVFADDEQFALTVENGTGSGVYCDNSMVTITADEPAPGMIFSHWSGQNSQVTDTLSGTTYVTIAGENITVTAEYAQLDRPYLGGPLELPGVVEIENFDNGGEGIAYHDTDPNHWSVFRTGEEVDINNMQEGSTDFFLGFIETGEWLEYSVNSTLPVYDLDVSYASGESGGTFHIEVDGAQVGGPVTVGGTGGWKSFETMNFYPFEVPEGEHILRLYMESGGFNLEHLLFSELVMYSFSAGYTGMGSVSPFGGEYKSGTEIEVTATPDEDYIFIDWTGDINSTENPVFVTMDGDISITANFVTDTVGVQSSLAGGVRIYPNPLHSGNLQIESPVRVRVLIMDITGKPILEYSGTRSFEVPSSAFQPGIYLVKVESDLFTKILQVIRE